MSSPYSTDASIETLMQGFENNTIPESSWTHEAHLAAAIYYNIKYEPADAICRIRSAIISFNLAAGGENTGNRGYHETLTVFWMKVARHFVLNYHKESLADTCNAFINSRLADKYLPLQFYDKAILMSPEVRSIYKPVDDNDTFYKTLGELLTITEIA